MDTPDNKQRNSFRCSATTDPIALAKSIAHVVRESKNDIVIQALGNQAVGQAVKAVVILNGLTASKGRIWLVSPSMDDVDMPHKDTGQMKAITVTSLRLVAGTIGEAPWLSPSG